MSLFGSLLRPVSQSAQHSTRLQRAAMACVDFCLPRENAGRARWASDDRRRTRLQNREQRTRTIEDIFVRSLVAAGTHHTHAPRHSRLSPPLRPQTCRPYDRNAAERPSPRRLFSTRSNNQKAEAVALPAPEISEDEYTGLVDTYNTHASEREKPKAKRPVVNHPYPLAPRLVVPPREGDYSSLETREKPPPPPLDTDHALQLSRLRRLVTRKPGTVEHAQLWELWDSLPTPRPRYLQWKYTRRFFRHLAWIEYKSAENATQRYFELLEECRDEGLPLDDGVWNTAIAYAGHWTRYLDSESVKRAIETWMRMENVGVQATEVTFNILFDLAVKAGRFALADTIHNELQARKMVLNRYFRVSMIYYAGIRGDGNAVRQAFRDLVQAQEIVDTGVMNCVLVSLIRAGEAPAAEHVFLKMKSLHEAKFGTERPDDWRGQKAMGVLLNETGARLRQEKEEHESSFFGSRHSADDRREEIQRVSPIAPDSRTFAILIVHHCQVTGDLDRILELIEELRARKLRLDGYLYVHLFRGFRAHGGYAFSLWTPARLEEMYKQCLEEAAQGPALGSSWARTGSLDDEHDLAALDEEWNVFPEEEGVPRSKSGVKKDPPEEHIPNSGMTRPLLKYGLVRSMLLAFHQCVGRKRTLEVYNETKEIQKDTGQDNMDDIETIDIMLERLLRD